MTVTHHGVLRVRQPRTGTATRGGAEQAQSMGDWPGPGASMERVNTLHAYACMAPFPLLWCLGNLNLEITIVSMYINRTVT